MIMRAKLGLLAAFASMFLFATDATRADDKTQVAVSQGHSVTIKVNVNNGDYVSARDVVMLIQPLDSDSPIKPTSLKGPGGTVELPEGNYRIVAQLMETQVEEKFAVAGPTEHLVDVQTGFATLKWIPDIGKKAIKDDVQWKILTYKKYNGERRLIASLAGSQPRLALPQGWYIAEASYKGQTKRLAIEVATGVQYDYVLCAAC